MTLSKIRGRFLFIAESLEGTSGWGSYSACLLRELRALGLEAVLLTADSSTQGPRLPSIHAGWTSWLWAAIRVWWWLGRQPPFEVVHIFVEPYARLSRLFAPPVFLTIHGTYARPEAHGPWWARWLFVDALERATSLICVSRYTLAKLPSEFSHKATVIHNGVDVSLLEASPVKPFFKAYPLILSVGAIKSRKGFDYLLRGFQKFIRAYMRAGLVIVGQISDKDEFKRLNGLIEECGLRDRVIFTGRVSKEELVGWYRACDVFALTPVERGGFEGFGLVYLVANLFGKAAVGSKHSGAVEAIEDGVTGVLVEPSSPEVIARGIQQALSLPTQQLTHYVSETASWTVRARAYVEVYSQMYTCQAR